MIHFGRRRFAMAKRGRVVGVVEEGHSRSGAASHPNVSVSFVVNLVRAFRSAEVWNPKPSGGRRDAKLKPNWAFLLAQAAEKPDISIAETGGGARRRDRREARSRFDVALAHPRRLPLQKKLCGPASKIVTTSNRRAGNGRP
jgi:transposase